MSTPFNRADFIPATAQLMRYLLKSDWQLLLEKSQHKLLSPGEVLIKEGSPASGLYLLQKGVMRVEQNRGGAVVTLSERGPGTILGEISFLEVAPSMASVVAEDACEVLLIERRNLNSLLNSVPGFAVRFYLSMATLLAERLSESAELVTQMHSLPNFNQIMTDHGRQQDIDAFADRLSLFLA